MLGLVNILIAILENKSLITKKEAEQLVEKLKYATLSDRYEDAKRLIEGILK